MKKDYWFNKLVNVLMKPDLPQNAEENAIMLFSTNDCEGLWYYLKLVPCKKNGFIPKIGVYTHDQIKEHDKKVYAKRMELIKKNIDKLGKHLPKDLKMFNLETGAVEEISELKHTVAPSSGKKNLN